METIDVDAHATRGSASTNQLGGGRPKWPAPIVRMDVDEVLAVDCLLPAREGYVRIRSQAAHMTLAAHGPEEARIVAWAARRFGHASIDRFACERGLLLLRQALADVRCVMVAPASARQVIDRARAEPGSICAEAVRVFGGILGSLAGDLALTFGALGGVYLGGKVPHQLGSLLPQSPLRRHFESKGRFGAYLAEVPIYIV